MHKKQFTRLSAAMAAAALSSALSPSRARADSFFDEIGITQLRAAVPTLTGTGVTVLQAEATTVDSNGFDEDNYQVDPGVAGVSANIIYVGTGGTSQSFNLIQESFHADDVAQYLASTSQGVAPGIANLINMNANWFGNAYILPDNPIPSTPKVINQSFSETPSGPYTAAVLDQAWDSFAASHPNEIIVSAAGNGGAIIQPGTAYNVITVGLYPFSTTTSSSSSPGDRAKPDIVAPVRSTGDDFTSFTTPTVSGAAALLVQAAGVFGVFSQGSDDRVVKALLLNGAVKPADWTHSATVPLDRQYGAGIVNVYNSYENLIAGEQGANATTLTASVGGVHAPINAASSVGIAGWNKATISSNSAADAVDHYVIDLSTASTLTTLTTTLTWLRAADPALTTEIRASNASTSSFTSAVNTINNLDLYLYDVNDGALSDLSVSAIDNVEHLYTLNLAPGKYDLEVLKNGGAVGTPNVFSNSETYGLAWNSATQSSATNAGTILFNQTNSIAITTAITGTGGITQCGTGTTTFTAANTYGATSVVAGKLMIGTGGTLGSLGAGAVTNNAALAFNHSDAITIANAITGTGSLLQIGSGTTTLSAYQGTGPVSIAAGKLAFASTNAPRQTPAVAIKMQSLTMSSGTTLDITNHDLIIGNTSYAAVQNQILAAFGAVTGPAITTSTSNVLGTGTDNTLPIPIDPAAFGLTSWDNVSITEPNSIIVKYTLFGDSTLDGTVNGDDFSVIAGNFGKTSPGISNILASWLMGDVTLDGFVNGDDFSVVAGNFGKGPLGTLDTPDAPAVVSSGGGSSNVPEPTSLALLGIGAAGLLLRRKKQ